MSQLNVNPYAVTHDELTGLPNSFLFYDRLNTSIATAERSTNRFAVLYIELKNIQKVAKKYGREISDSLLIQITGRLNDMLRDADSIGRLGEYEFAVVISHVIDKKAIDSLVYRVYKIIGLPCQINTYSFNMKASIGMSVYPDNGTSATALINYATAHTLSYD